MVLPIMPEHKIVRHNDMPPIGGLYPIMPQNVVLLMILEHKVAQNHDVPLTSGPGGHIISRHGNWSYR